MITLERDVPVPLGDGTVTRADVWRDPAGPPGPVILVRTPYLKEAMAPSVQIDPRAASDHGVVLVIQDVRGTGTSGGTFAPFVHEAADGADTIGWVRRQPWCDGRVGMLGMSYVGATQWHAAGGRPDGLMGIAPTLSSDTHAEGWSFTNGVREHAFLTSWCAANLAPMPERWLDDIARSFTEVAAVAAVAPWLTDWLTRPADDPAWPVPVTADGIPAFVTAGWYDVFCTASIASFTRRANAADRLLIGPWAHEPTLSHHVGIADVGAAGNGAVAGFAERVLGWYDDIFAGRSPSGPRVAAYVLDARRWLEADDWPPPGSRPADIPLVGTGRFEVEPDDLPPSIGGRGLQVLVPTWGFGVGDQRPLLAHPGTVGLEATVATDTLAAGPLGVALEVDAEGGDERLWTATLCVERADGALHNLAEGVIRAPVDAGRVSIPLGHLCVELPAGSRLVVIVGGGSWPRWERPVAPGVQRVQSGRLQLTVL